MAGKGLGDYSVAIHMRDIIEEIAQKVIDRSRPRQQYAKVTSIDRTNKRCGVVFPGDDTSVLIPMGTIQPRAVGQTVRIVGTPDDRYIAEVVGPGDPYVAGAAAAGTINQILYSPTIVPFTRTGNLTVTTGTQRFRFPVAARILGVTASVVTPPQGTSIIADLNVNGISAFSTQANRPTILSTENSTRTTTVPDVVDLVVGDYLTVDIDQIGNVVPGSDLSVYVQYIQTGSSGG